MLILILSIIGYSIVVAGFVFVFITKVIGKTCLFGHDPEEELVEEHGGVSHYVFCSKCQTLLKHKHYD